MLSRSAALALGATTALVAAQRCLDKYQCMFHHDYNGVEYSWDLHTLCKDGPYLTEPASAVGTPATDYVWTNQAGQNFTFNICGNASAVCAWDPVQAEYNSRGVVVQVCVLGGSRPVRTLSTPVLVGPGDGWALAGAAFAQGLRLVAGRSVLVAGWAPSGHTTRHRLQAWWVIPLLPCRSPQRFGGDPPPAGPCPDWDNFGSSFSALRARGCRVWRRVALLASS
jgi:hypothetical protein